MSDDELQIPCDSCGEEFNPDLSSKKGWTCPNCSTRRPNLTFHYRLLAWICAGGLIWVLYLLGHSILRRGGLALRQLLPLLQAGLLLLPTIIGFRSKRPWQSNILMGALYAVFSSFVLFYLLQPVLAILLLGADPTPTLLTFLIASGAALFALGTYLVWLRLAGKELA